MSIALVTGANQGIGFAIVKALAQSLSQESVVYLTGRNLDACKKAVEEIDKNASAVKAKVVPLRIDVTINETIEGAAKLISEKHGGIDIVIANAGGRMSKAPWAEQVEGFLAINNHGNTYSMMKSFIPLLNKNARYIVVASSLGQLSQLDAKLHDKFDFHQQSLEDIEELMREYAKTVKEGTQAQAGWPDWINIPSKVAQICQAKIANRLIQKTRPRDGILMNALCPGLVQTEASRPWFDPEEFAKSKTPDEAAEYVIWLALLPPGTTEPTGELIQYKKILPWK